MGRDEQEAQSNSFYGLPPMSDAEYQREAYEASVMQATADKAVDLMAQLVADYQKSNKKAMQHDGDALEDCTDAVDLDGYTNVSVTSWVNDKIDDLLDENSSKHDDDARTIQSVIDRYNQRADWTNLLAFDA